MNIKELILYKIAKKWPSPVKYKKKYGLDVTSDEYHLNYALNSQYLKKARFGANFNFYNKSILEIGCGHGGISCFLAVNGARNVVGIDLNDNSLRIANLFRRRFEFVIEKTNKRLPVKFINMNATELKFDDHTFDCVIADNVFEHFNDPQKVLSEIYRVLKPKGELVIPAFSSWWSKHALHLKHGLKVPWTNLIFSEKTIVNVLYSLAKDNPEIFKMYPGLKDKPDKIRDVRKYKDLNYITYNSFKKMAKNEGFKILSFNLRGSNRLVILSLIARKIPFLNATNIVDIFSTSASAKLKK